MAAFGGWLGGRPEGGAGGVSVGFCWRNGGGLACGLAFGSFRFRAPSFGFWDFPFSFPFPAADSLVNRVSGVVGSALPFCFVLVYVFMSLGQSLGDFISADRSIFQRRFRLGKMGEEGDFSEFRLVFLRVLAAGSFLILFGALFQVQIFKGEYYRGLAEGNRIAEVPIHAPRGIIFDRNGVALVSNLPAFRLRTCRKEGDCEARIISKDQAIALEAQGLAASQTLEVDSGRFYPYGKSFAHILGYVSEVSKDELSTLVGYSPGDKMGREGVEESYNSLLLGKDGKELVEVDASGQKLRTLSTVEPIPGQNLTLSIDADLQKVAYQQIEGKKAAVVATDPKSGAVLALASSPSYDPNIFTDLSLESEYRNAQIRAIFSDSSQPLFNRAISGTYPAGSTFKIVTALAGLESGKIDENFTIDDPGILVIGPYKFPNWKYLRDGGTQGVLNVVGALQKSNDIFFYEVGGKVEVDLLGQYARKVGVSEKLGIDLPGEAAGLFPDAAWRNNNSRSWYLGDTYHLAIGQGDLLVTPLQDNAWTAVIGNGGKLCIPSVLGRDSGDKIQETSQETRCKDLGISQKTIGLIRQGMVAACQPGGTAYPLFGFKDGNGNPVAIACKTGTAEYGDPQGRTHAWLTAFAPAKEPTIALTVLVEGGGGGGEGSDVAAPIAKKILEEWFAK